MAKDDAKKGGEKLNEQGETQAQASQRINEEAEARVRAENKIKEETRQKDEALAKARADNEAEAKAKAEALMKSAAEVAPNARMVVPQGQLQKEWKVPEATGTMVEVNVPKGFKLTFAHGQTLEFSPGIQLVDECVLDHWYSKANGMTKARMASARDES